MILFTKEFRKQFKKIRPDIRKKFNGKIPLFLNDEYHPILKNHTLQGIWKNYRSINVSGDVRAIYKKDGSVAIFVAIGTHGQLYS